MENQLTEAEILATIKSKVEDLKSKGVDAPTIAGVIATYFRQRTLDRIIAKDKLSYIRRNVGFVAKVAPTCLPAYDTALLNSLIETITKLLSTEEVA